MSRPSKDRSITGEEESTVTAYSPKETKLTNVIFIGDSRCGKTTFLRILRDPKYRPSKINISAETKTPESHTMIVEVDNKNLSINVIDTPGFNELSGDGFTRTNVLIADMIKKMVTTNVVQLSLIVMFVNGKTGLTKNQADSLEYLISELGHEFCDNLCLMVTNTEDYDENDEKDWVKQYNESEDLRRIVLSCRAGVLFTGACSNKDDEVFASYFFKQNTRMVKFLKGLITIKPLSLVTEEDPSESSFLEHGLAVSSKLIEIQKVKSDIESRLKEMTSRHLQISDLCVKMQTSESKEFLNNSSNLIKDIQVSMDKLAILELEGELSKLKELESKLSGPAKHALSALNELSAVSTSSEKQQKDILFALGAARADAKKVKRVEKKKN